MILRLLMNHMPTANGASAAAPQGEEGGGDEDGGSLELEMGVGVFAIGGTSVAVTPTNGADTVLSTESIVGSGGSGVGV